MFETQYESCNPAEMHIRTRSRFSNIEKKNLQFCKYFFMFLRVQAMKFIASNFVAFFFISRCLGFLHLVCVSKFIKIQERIFLFWNQQNFLLLLLQQYHRANNKTFQWLRSFALHTKKKVLFTWIVHDAISKRGTKESAQFQNQT